VWKVLASAAVACSSPSRPPLSHVEPAGAALSYCIERETSCERAHTELVGGKPVTIVGALDCVGPRHVECTFADGRHDVIAGEATDVVGLGGGSYRYLEWHDDRPTLVTVAGGRRTRVPGGAARTYGPFGPYGRTAESRDGRIAAMPEPDGETLNAIVVRDTTHNIETAKIALRPPIAVSRAHPHVVMSHDGVRVGLCMRSPDGLVLQLADRVIRLPGSSCVAADADLARVIVRTAIDSLAVVELASGRSTALAARQAAFAGRDGVVMIAEPMALAHEHLPTKQVTRFGTLPFRVDEIRVAADGAAAILFHEKAAGDPPRAYAVRLPRGPGYEIHVPEDTVDITIVP